MTPEKIKKIAEEVAHLRAFDGGFFPHEMEIREDYEVLLQWLSARYYLVEKGKVEKRYKRYAKYGKTADNNCGECIRRIICKQIFEPLFGPDIRKEEEE